MRRLLRLFLSTNKVVKPKADDVCPRAVQSPVEIQGILDGSVTYGMCMYGLYTPCVSFLGAKPFRGWGCWRLMSSLAKILI